MPIDRDTCRDFARSSKLEWLETNGTGGFAMGTVAGTNTRRYHGLLVASLRPPVGGARVGNVGATKAAAAHARTDPPTTVPSRQLGVDALVAPARTARTEAGRNTTAKRVMSRSWDQSGWPSPSRS